MKCVLRRIRAGWMEWEELFQIKLDNIKKKKSSLSFSFKSVCVCARACIHILVGCLKSKFLSPSEGLREVSEWTPLFLSLSSGLRSH